MSRIEALLGFLEEDPNDTFSRYALAMEYNKLERRDEAIREFETITRDNPGYVAVYYQLAKVYESQGQVQDAERTYRTGIEVATSAGDEHARGELQEALNMLQGL